MRPGIVAALPGEARPLARLRAQGRASLPGGARLALSGMGPRRAEQTARELVSQGAGALVSWGSAAGLAPVLASGDLLLPKFVKGADGRTMTVDEAWRTRLTIALEETVRIRESLLVEQRELLTDVESKKRLYEQTGAVACDMESAAIARVAAEHDLPFIAIRAIVDEADMSLPPAAQVAVDETGALRPFRLVRSLVAPPGGRHAQLRALKQLGVAFKAAQNTLRSAAPALLENGSA